jgi:hypothetical protein
MWSRLLLPMIIFLFYADARCEVQKLSEQSWWSAYGGVRDDGLFTCALVTATPDGRGGKFVIEHLSGTETLSIRMVKPTWTVPKGKFIDVIVQFGFLPARWNIRMYGRGHEFQGEVPGSKASEFMSGFRGSGRIDVTFPGGTETPWSLATGGEGIVEPDFAKCLRMNIRPSPASPTQP